MSLNWDLLVIFSWLDWDSLIMGKEKQRLKVPSHHINPTLHAIGMTDHCWCWPWPGGSGSVCLGSALYFHSFYPLSLLYFLALSHYAWIIFKELGVKLYILKRWRIYINYLEFLCMRDSSSLSHLFIYSIIYWCQCRLMNIYVLLWVIINCYFINFVSQIVPALAPGDIQFAPVSLWWPTVIVVLFYFIYFN